MLITDLFTALTKMLVATGYGFLKSIEVVNLDASKPNLVCDNLPDFPVGLEGGTGQLFQGTTPIICGGARPNRFVDSCDCYALKNGGWNKISSLQECRRYASSTLVTLENQEEVLMITGGQNSNTLKSAESFNGTDWEQLMFSDMLQPAWLHCIVKINLTTLLLVGGFNTGTMANTYFYQLKENAWTSGPSLQIARNGLSCGIMNWNNPETNQVDKVIVAAGGYNQDSVELLFIDGGESNAWVLGPPLPKYAVYSTMVEFQNSVILIGGEGGVDGLHLYQLSSPNGTWVEMKQTLREKKSKHVSFLVPDELVNCH
jgi:hypothetical protein